MTFTIVARDDRSGMLGIACASGALLMHSIAIGSSPAVGLVAAQGVPNPYLAQGVLDSLRDRGQAPDQAIARPLASDPDRDYRQVAALDARGNPAAFTGRRNPPFFGHIAGTDHATAGTRLGSASVIGAMSLSFERSGGDPLWERLLLALESGDRAGGDTGGTTAAIVQVFGGEAYPLLDLRVEDHPQPVAELRRLVARWHDAIEGVPDFRATIGDPLPHREQLERWLGQGRSEA